jgi:hypothetical protein
MKLNRIVLGASAVLATAVTALAFKPAKNFSAGTLATWNSTTQKYVNVACARAPIGTACSNSLTYFTRVSHTSIGKTAYVVAQ